MKSTENQTESKQTKWLTKPYSLHGCEQEPKRRRNEIKKKIEQP